MSRHSRVTTHTVATLCAAALACAALAGCKTNATIDRNQIPVANAGDDQVHPFAGTPVTVTLDASRSSDRDGQLVGVVWLNGTDADAGGVMLPDPPDVPFSQVTLGQGVWLFHLFVQDDDGAISAPDTVQITIGDVAMPSCDLSACAPTLGDPCCTSDDTGAMPGDSRGRAPGQCGADLGSIGLAALAGICLELNQEGAMSAECPELPNAANQMEPGCCTAQGLCGSINTSVPLGCHYPSMMAPTPCTP